jgi:hypothetical protein
MLNRRMIRAAAVAALLGAAACGKNEGGAIGDEKTDVGEGTTGIAQPGDAITPSPPMDPAGGAADTMSAGGGTGTVPPSP